MKKTGFIGLFAVLALQAARGQWCVATNGNDTYTGLGWDQAVATISNAVRKAHLAGGGLVEVSNGVYVLTGGEITVSAGTTVRGVNGRDYTVVDGNGTTRCFTLNHTGAVLQGVTVSNGYVIGSGGGATVNRGAVYDCRFTHNTASNGYGGGIYFNALVQTTMAITNSLFTYNVAQRGGGVGAYDGYLAYRGSLDIQACDFVSNIIYQGSSESYGGGVYFYGGNLTVRTCRFFDNQYAGGASGSAYGGGLSINAAHLDVLVERCQFVGNMLTNVLGVAGGGGLHLSGGRSVVRNCLIARNRAYRNPRGAGVYIEQANNTNLIESCAIAGNVHGSLYGYGGAGIYLSGNGQDQVWNCVVISNTDNAAAADWFFGDTARTNNVHYTCTPQAMGGAGNTRNPPLFADFAGGDYRVLAESPCVLAGTNRPWMDGARDLDGHPRVDRFTRRVDMGPYQRLLRGVVISLR